MYHYKYAAAAYADSCAHPNGQTLVATVCPRYFLSWAELTVRQFVDRRTDTQGYIARDDVKQEFIVAFRGRYAALPPSGVHAVDTALTAARV